MTVDTRFVLYFKEAGIWSKRVRLKDSSAASVLSRLL